MAGDNEGVHELAGKGDWFIAGGQIKNKVLGYTHIFSAYPFNGACQPMISYD